MKNTSDKTTKGGLTVQTAIKAGGFIYNHNRGVLKVRAGVKAGGLPNHNVRGLKVRAGVKVGGIQSFNHNRAALAVSA